MKLAVEFPSVVFREGPQAVAELARGIERIGYHQIDVFDHVVMGHPPADRPAGPYAATMPLLEALTTLGFLAAVTEKVGLGTEVLVLPQRHPTLVAKQAATLDTLSGGRLRLGVGVGWQRSEYDALGVDFGQRGAMMDEAIALLRLAWGADPIDFAGRFYRLEAMAMEPKPPQGARLPVWIGGRSDAALRRAGRLGDGWMAVRLRDPEEGRELIARVRDHAVQAGRDPAVLGFEAQISPPPRPGSAEDRTFYAEPKRVAEITARLHEAGFGWAAINATGVFLAGARSTAALLDALAALHAELRAALPR